MIEGIIDKSAHITANILYISFTYSTTLHSTSIGEYVSPRITMQGRNGYCNCTLYVHKAASV